MDNGMVPLFEEATPIQPETSKKKAGNMRVILMQCLCCAALVGLFWLFRLFGGNAYTSLRGAFQEALQNNALLATVSGIFHDDTPDKSYLLNGGTTQSATDKTANGTTLSTTAGTTGETASGTITQTATVTTSATTYG